MRPRRKIVRPGESLSSPTSNGGKNPITPRTDKIETDEWDAASTAAQRAKLVEFAVQTHSFNRTDDLVDTVLRIEIQGKEGTFGIDETEGQLIIKPRYSLEAWPQNEAAERTEPVLTIEATFVLVYSCENVAELSRDAIVAVPADPRVPRRLAIWRELVWNACIRMRVPVIIVKGRFQK